MESYDPSAIVLQCGTDSLSGDKLGCLNLSMRGRILKAPYTHCKLGIHQGTQTASSLSSRSISPCCFLGEADIRCETLVVRGHTRQDWLQGLSSDLVRNHHNNSIKCGLTKTPKEIPVNEYYEYFGPDYELDVKASNTEDMNTPGYLERVKNIVMENLRKLKGPPSVQMTGTERIIVCY